MVKVLGLGAGGRKIWFTWLIGFLAIRPDVELALTSNGHLAWLRAALLAMTILESMPAVQATLTKRYPVTATSYPLVR